jgi:hypothetical protein
MKRTAWQCLLGALLCGGATLASPHGCDPLDKYLLGHYHGDCDAATELPQGTGEAKGADRYVGQFVQGRPEGRGVYVWENGARLEGAFREGKAHGRGVFVSVSGKRYEGEFAAGRMSTLPRADCPTTPGPVDCR